MSQTDPNNLAAVLVALMRGVIYRDSHAKLWSTLERAEFRVRDHIKPFGLCLFLDPDEGHAFLRQREAEEGEEEFPRLIARRPLGYAVSLLCVLLRKRLLEADRSGDAVKVVITRDEVIRELQVFLPDVHNEVRMIQQIDTHLEKLIRMGFLRKLDQAQHFEIRSVLKSLVDAEMLSTLEERLQRYREHAAAEDSVGNSDVVTTSPSDFAAPEDSVGNSAAVARPSSRISDVIADERDS